MLPDLFLPVRRHQDTDAIAEFKHQIRRGHEVGVVAPDVQQMDRKTAWQWKTGQRHPDYVGFPDEHADVVKIGSVLDQLARRQPPEPRRRLPDCLFLLGYNQNGVSR
jgi:hypothetical protein